MISNLGSNMRRVGVAAGILVGAQAYAFSGFSDFAAANGSAAGFNSGGFTGGYDAGFDTLQLTDGNGGEASSAFSNTQIDLTSNFSLSFHYSATDFGGLGPADGMALVFQGNGTNSLGTGGDGLGYAGMGNSAAVAFNIWEPVGPAGRGTEFLTGGNVDHNYVHTDPVDLTSALGVDVYLSYNATTHLLDEQLFQGGSFFDVFTTLDLGGAVGSNSAYLGFTGGDGGGYSDQRISDLNMPGRIFTPEPISMSLMAGSALAGFLKMRRRKNSV